MSKNWKLIAFLGLFGLFIAGFFSIVAHEKKSAKNEVKIENLTKENSNQNEAIKINNFQKKLVNKTVVNNDVAARKQWLQLIFQERDELY